MNTKERGLQNQLLLRGGNANISPPNQLLFSGGNANISPPTKSN